MVALQELHNPRKTQWNGDFRSDSVVVPAPWHDHRVIVDAIESVRLTRVEFIAATDTVTVPLVTGRSPAKIVTGADTGVVRPGDVTARRTTWAWSAGPKAGKSFSPLITT
jgi:hypothetical protein